MNRSVLTTPLRLVFPETRGVPLRKEGGAAASQASRCGPDETLFSLRLVNIGDATSTVQNASFVCKNVIFFVEK